jgi:DNA-binding transcriptional regulator YdaS (Cro superfamily)
MNQIIQKACDLVGGQTALAKMLSIISRREIKQQRVYNWLSRGDSVPVELMAPIEKATKGRVTRKDFRPDDWDVIWPELAAPRRRASDKKDSP